MISNLEGKIVGGKKSGKSPLSAKANEKRNTKAGRAKMPASDFALPAVKKYRIDDAAHARTTLARISQYGTPAQQKQVQAAVRKRYPSMTVAGRKGKSRG